MLENLLFVFRIISVCRFLQAHLDVIRNDKIGLRLVKLPLFIDKFFCSRGTITFLYLNRLITIIMGALFGRSVISILLILAVVSNFFEFTNSISAFILYIV